MTKDFLLPLVPRSFLSLHLGPGLSHMPAKSGLAFPLTTDGADGIYKALQRESVSGCCTSTHCRRICLLSHLLKDFHRENQPQGSAAAISVVLVRYPVTVLAGKTKWVLKATGEKKPLHYAQYACSDHLLGLSEVPHHQMLLGWGRDLPWSQDPSTVCHEVAGQSSSWMKSYK